GARPGHAVVEVLRQPIPDRSGEPRVLALALGVSHRLSRVPARGARDRQLSGQLGRLRLRPGDHRAGGRRALPHRRDRGADALFPGGVVRELRRLGRLRRADPLRALLVHAQPARPSAVPSLRQPTRRVPPPALPVAARLLEAAAACVALLLAVMIATGGFTAAGRSFTRADELVIAFAVIVALRALAVPLGLPALAPARIAILGAA